MLWRQNEPKSYSTRRYISKKFAMWRRQTLQFIVCLVEFIRMRDTGGEVCYLYDCLVYCLCTLFTPSFKLDLTDNNSTTTANILLISSHLICHKVSTHARASRAAVKSARRHAHGRPCSDTDLQGRPGGPLSTSLIAELINAVHRERGLRSARPT